VFNRSSTTPHKRRSSASCPTVKPARIQRHRLSTPAVRSLPQVGRPDSATRRVAFRRKIRAPCFGAARSQGRSSAFGSRLASPGGQWARSCTGSSSCCRAPSQCSPYVVAVQLRGSRPGTTTGSSAAIIVADRGSGLRVVQVIAPCIARVVLGRCGLALGEALPFARNGWLGAWADGSDSRLGQAAVTR
jgi:hypothetical protein